MKLALEADIDCGDCLKWVSAITDKARFSPNEVVHDRDRRVVTLRFHGSSPPGRPRGNVIGRFLRGDTERDSVTVEVTVRSVNCVTTNNNCEVGTEELTSLFGLQFRPDEVYLSCAEETQGRQLFDICIRVDQIDLAVRVVKCVAQGRS